MATNTYQPKTYTPSETLNQKKKLLEDHQKNKPGEYQSQYKNGLDDLIGQIRNRPDFQYDVNSDALYQQVAQNYLRQGQQAMMDTMGQAAALTGGYGNSYAQTAGQQTYQEHLQGLSDMVPQFQQMALDQYQLEGEDLLNQYNILKDQEDTDYNRYLDMVKQYYDDLDRYQNAYNDERDYDYNRYVDDRDFDYGKYKDEQEYQYKVDRDAVEDEQWLKELQYQQERDRIEDEQWQKEFDEDVRQFNQNYNLSLMSKNSSRSSGGSSKNSSQSKNAGGWSFTEYMNERSRNGMTTQQAANEITAAAEAGIIKKEDQLNYMFLYG